GADTFHRQGSQPPGSHRQGHAHVPFVDPVATNLSRPPLTRPHAMTHRHHRSFAPSPAMTSAPPRLAVIDPSAVMRAGLPLLLTGFTVTAGFPSVKTFLTSGAEADIVLVDIAVDGGRETAAVRTLARI